VVRALLSRNIAVLGNSDGTVGGLAIDLGAYQQIVVDARVSPKCHQPAKPRQDLSRIEGPKSLRLRAA